MANFQLIWNVTDTLKQTALKYVLLLNFKNLEELVWSKI